MVYMLCPGRDINKKFRKNQMVFPHTHTCLSLKIFGYPASALQQDLIDHYCGTLRVLYVCLPKHAKQHG